MKSLDRLEVLAQQDMQGLALQALDQLPLPLVIVDELGRIVIFNREAELFFGWPREMVAGQPVEMLVMPEARDRHEAHRDRYMASPQIRMMGEQTMKLSGVHRTGRELPSLDINLAPLVTNGGIYTSAVVRRPHR